MGKAHEERAKRHKEIYSPQAPMAYRMHFKKEHKKG
jgi:hypothetical protein